MRWLAGRPARQASAPRSSPARMRLLVLLPLTMGALVWATGFFATGMTRRAYVTHGVTSAETERLLRQMDLQLIMIAVIAGILAFGIAFGVTTPLRAFADRLAAVKSGDLRAPLRLQSAPEVEWLATSFNEALTSMNRYLLQSMSGANISLDTSGLIVGASPAAELILGYREDDLLGQRFSRVFAPPGAGQAELAALEHAILSRQPVRTDETYIGTKDGRRVRVGVSVSYLRQADQTEPDGRTGTPGEDVINVTIGFKDVAEIRRLRDHLRKADQLVALGTLTAGVAHELRNPLASMRGLAELMSRDFGAEDPRQRYASTMMESIDRLNELVENLLLLTSDVASTREHVDVLDLVREVTHFAILGLGQRAVDITIDPAAGGAPVSLQGNRNRLIQALSNIMLNAVQATPDGGHVRISVVPSDHHVTIRVHNTGSHIPADVMKRLFVPFFTTKPTGTGLGLAIARQIVSAHNGRIFVESDEQTGTSFILELPAAGPAPAARADATLTATAPCG
jgi:two-component system, NtrC family, sensor histidine kinase AtoS